MPSALRRPEAPGKLIQAARRNCAARSRSAASASPPEVADLAAAILTNAYLTNQVISLDGGIHPR